MRDGSKRRPRRRVLKIVLLSLGAIGVVLVVLLARAYTAKPGAAPNVAAAFNQYIVDYYAKVPGAVNGFNTLAKAVESYRQHMTTVASRRPEDAGADAEWFADPIAVANGTASLHIASATRMLEQEMLRHGTEQLLSQLRVATYSHRAIPSSKTVVDISEYPISEVRGLAKYCIMQMSRHAQTASWPAYNLWLSRCLALSRLASTEPLLIPRLIAHSIVQMAFSQVIADLRAARLPPESLSEMLEIVEEQGRLEPFAYTLGGEQVYAEAALALFYTDNGRGDGVLLLDRADPDGVKALFGFELPDTKAVNVLAIFLPGKRQALARLRQFVEEVRTYAETSAYKRRGIVEPSVDTIPRGFIFTRTVAEAYTRTVRTEDEYELRLLLVRATIAIELHRAENGSLPTSLNQLQGILDTVPIDPCTGKPLCYRVLPDGEAAEGPGYLVYSTGIDGTDDGGIAPGQLINAIKPGATGVDATLE